MFEIARNLRLAIVAAAGLLTSETPTNGWDGLSMPKGVSATGSTVTNGSKSNPQTADLSRIKIPDGGFTLENTGQFLKENGLAVQRSPGSRKLDII